MIEPVTVIHVPVIAAIHHTAFASGSWTAESFTALLSVPFTFGFLYQGGFILARAVEREAEILTFAVVPEQRRQGLARSLLVAMLAEARRRGAFEVFLEVAKDNKAAVSLYDSAGFVQAGCRRDYYGPGKAALLLRHALE